MYTILEKSRSEKPIRNFRSLRWESSNKLPNTSTETFWKIRTNFRKFRFIQYLQMKMIMGLASDLEIRCLLDVPGVLEDNLFRETIKAFQTNVPKEILWRRLQWLQGLLQEQPWSPNLYYTWAGTITYEIVEARSSIRKAKKYTGYVRTPSSVGSKRSNTGNSEPPEIFEWNSYEELNYYEFLIVGRFSGPNLEISILP